jgi:hypothetical protein
MTTGMAIVAAHAIDPNAASDLRRGYPNRPNYFANYEEVRPLKIFNQLED